MKKIPQLLLSAILLVTILWSCKKDENRVIFDNGTQPVLTASVTGTVPVNYLTKDNEAIKINWTNPEYKFNTGISSYDVSYAVEIDTAGANFTNPNKKVLSISKDLSLSIKQSDFNDYMSNQLLLDTAIAHNIEMRVKSSLLGSTGILYSNVLKFSNVKGYGLPAKVTPPASGELYITGNAVPSDWTNSPPSTQKFTRVSATFYTITVPLIGGNSYIFLSTYGSWNDKYSIAIKNNPASVNGGDFQWQGNDILAPGATGSYKIEVDFQIGKFTVTKQ
jgi:starch-binding outer membrane protein SusE/F